MITLILISFRYIKSIFNISLFPLIPINMHIQRLSTFQCLVLSCISRITHLVPFIMYITLLNSLYLIGFSCFSYYVGKGTPFSNSSIFQNLFIQKLSLAFFHFSSFASTTVTTLMLLSFTYDFTYLSPCRSSSFVWERRHQFIITFIFVTRINNGALVVKL